MPKSDVGTRDISDSVAAIEAGLDGYEPPAAWGVGVGIISKAGRMLSVRFPTVNKGESWGAMAILADVLGYRSGTMTYEMNAVQMREASERLEALAAETDGPHDNLEAWKLCFNLSNRPAEGGLRVVVVTVIDNLYQAPLDAVDCYFRLNLLSQRKCIPNSISLNGIFGHLNTAVWTNHGPIEPDEFEAKRIDMISQGRDVVVHLIDKFPRMVDYVVPSGVRIADANRVRMGAYLSEGTVIMHEGFCNFNAGTLGGAMIEGRISQGVIVGADSDIGGSASIMGTLSGGGEEVISVGERSLIGANGGIGISIGDDCIVEAGCYITAGTLVTLPDGEVVKARELSGHHNLLFRRHSKTGAIEALPRDGAKWTGLNAALHDNNTNA